MHVARQEGKGGEGVCSVSKAWTGGARDMAEAICVPNPRGTAQGKRR
jgi:hypothetical protein